MIPAEAWEVFNLLLLVIGALGGGAFGLEKMGILRLGRAAPPPPEPATPAPPPVDESLGNRVARLEHNFMELQLAVAERYMRREDWIPFASRVMGTLEGLSCSVARLEVQIGTPRRHEDG